MNRVDKTKVLELYNSGESANEIGRILGNDHSVILYHLRKMDLKIRNAWDRCNLRISSSDIEKLYTSGLSINQIGKKYNMSGEGIRGRLNKIGVKLRSSEDGLNLARLQGRVVVPNGKNSPNWKHGKYKIKCNICGNVFEDYSHDRKYCSFKCFNMGHRSGKNVKCSLCGKLIYRSNCKLKTTKHSFCSIKCTKKYYSGSKNNWYGKDLSGSNNPSWKGGSFIDPNTGYKMVLIIGKGTYTTEQKRLMEISINRKLTKDEVVHHINGNKLDNRIENLLLTTRTKHPSLHKRSN